MFRRQSLATNTSCNRHIYKVLKVIRVYAHISISHDIDMYADQTIYYTIPSVIVTIPSSVHDVILSV